MKAAHAHAGHSPELLQKLPGRSLLEGCPTAKYGISGYGYAYESALLYSGVISGGEVYRIGTALSRGNIHHLTGMGGVHQLPEAGQVCCFLAVDFSDDAIGGKPGLISSRVLEYGTHQDAPLGLTGDRKRPVTIFKKQAQFALFRCADQILVELL